MSASVHPLDRPIWSALTSCHAHMATGGPAALRYPADTSPFTATKDDSGESLRGLSALKPLGGSMILLQTTPIALPCDLQPDDASPCVQMLADDPFPALIDPRIRPLGPADAGDMFELADLTKPGPFSLKSLDMGAFWGIRDGGRLVAMGGERLKIPGHTELSGLCTHPDVRGTGLGKLMLRYVAGQISSRNEKVFLHAYASNEGAIALYESLGFRLRSAMHFAFIEDAAA